MVLSFLRSRAASILLVVIAGSLGTAGLASAATLDVSFTPNAELHELVLPGEKNVLGTFTFTAQGNEITIEKIILRSIASTDDEVVTKLRLKGEDGETFAGPSTVENQVAIFDTPFILDAEKAEKIFLEAEIEGGTGVGKKLGFEISRALNITAEDAIHTTAEIAGTFPIKTGTFFTSDAALKTILEFLPGTTTGTETMAGAKGVELGRFMLKAHGTETATLTKIILTKSTTAPDAVFENIRLVDNAGKIIFTSNDLSKGKAILTGEVSIPAGDEEELRILTDIAADAPAGAGQSVGYEIAGMSDVALSESATQKILNNFPIRFPKKEISAAEVRLALAPESPQAKPISPRSDGVTIASFTLTSGVEKVTLEKITLTKGGTSSSKALRNIRLTDEKGVVLFSFSGMTAEGDLEVAAHTTKTLFLQADTYGTEEIGKTLSLGIAETSDLRVVSQSGTEVSVQGAFPVTSGLMTFSDVSGEAFVNVSLESYSAILQKLFPGTPQTPLAKIRFTATKGDIEVQKILLTVPKGADLLQNVKLVTPYGKVLATEARPENGLLSFNLFFPVREEKTEEIFLIADISEDAAEGEVLTFALQKPADVKVLQIEGLLPAGTAGNFPFAGPKFTITNVTDIKYLKIFSEILPTDLVPRNSPNIVTGKLHLTAMGGKLTLESFRLKVSGTGLDQVSELRIGDEKNPELKTYRDVLEGVLTFDEPLTLPEGQEKVLTFTLDLEGSGEKLNTVVFEISSDRYIEVKTENSAVAPVIAHFPLRVVAVSTSKPEEFFCTTDYEPACGRKYPSCESGNCKPLDTTYSNFCNLRQQEAYFIFAGKCEDMPKSELPEEEEESEAGDEEAPFAEYDDPVLENVSAYKNPFPDTSLSKLEGTAALELFRRKVIGGFPDGTFRGSAAVNRAEAAKFLLQARYGVISENPKESRFPDVPLTEWFAKYVLLAAQKGIINGYPDQTFRPGNQVNTAEFLKMLTLTFGLPVNQEHHYADVQSGDWFYVYAGTAERYELFPERTKLLRPDTPLTRAEVAIALYQYFSNRDE
jgi:hypothetical protein